MLSLAGTQRGSKRGQDFPAPGYLVPKIALPTRTWVAPTSIAVSKSADMPIDKVANPFRFAILASNAK